MSTTTRRRYTAKQKVSILRQHLIERKPISDVCQAHGIRPSMFYNWQKRLFENGAAAFASDKDPQHQKLERKVKALQTKLEHKDRVIAQVTEEFVNVKKQLGDP